MISFFRRACGLLFTLCALMLVSTAAQADPPYRVARLSFTSGNVGFSPAGEADWSHAALNRPLINGDRLWVPDRARAEIQLGGTVLRAGDEASLAILNIDDRIAQLQLTQGTLEIRVWQISQGQVVEIDTPNFAVSIRQAGRYRIDADEKDASTAVTVRAGSATLYGEGRAFRIGPADTWRFYDTALRDYESYRPTGQDALERFALQRDQRWERSVSARYVSREMTGFADLDDSGTWRQVRDYGWVWTPTRVANDWAPYRDGHWSWVEPWGWTWVDDAAWGFAPSHYGRWANLDNRWSWIPGPVRERPVYAPALVAFVSASASSGVIGWFPLAPREVYRPSYETSRDYFTRVNVSNTVVNVTQVTNVYQTRNVTNIVYANQRVANAVVTVPTQTFIQARPVARDILRAQANVQPQAVVVAAPVSPVRQSVMGAQPAAQRPPETIFRRQVVAQTPPPPPPTSLEQKLPQMQKNPGQALPAVSAPARPAAPSAASPAVPAPAVKVVPAAPAASAPPAPPAPPASRAEREKRQEERQQRREERKDERPALPAAAAPPAAAPPAAPAPAPAPAPARAPAPASATAPATAVAPPAAAPPAPTRPAPAPAPAPTAPAPAAQPAPGPRASEAPASQQRDQRQQQREERQQQRGTPAPVPAPAPAVAPPAPAQPTAPAPAPVSPRPTPQPPPAPAPQPQAAPPAAAAAPAVSSARDQRQQQRDERRQERPAPAPQAAPQPAPPPAAPPAPPAAPQRAQPPAPPPQAAPQPPAASAPPQRAEERRQAASERRQAASEAREERRRP